MPLFIKLLHGGIFEQDWFLNTVIEIKTTLTPRHLLSVLLTIEKKIGRVRNLRWGPRVIDLDLLLYGDALINEPDLIIPHPRMVERAFVMVPLADLEPDLYIAGYGKAKELSIKLIKYQNVILFK